MRTKNKQKTEKTRSGRSFITVFGGLSSVFAAILLFAGTEAFFMGDGRAAPVLTVCFGILFAVIAVLIHRSASASKDWTDASFTAAAVLTAAGILSLILIGKAVKPAEIVLAVFLAVLTGALYILRKDRPGSAAFYIPVILGIITSATGILTLNTVFCMVFSGGKTDRLWIGVFFAAFFLVLSRFLTGEAYPEERKDRASLVTFGSAFLTQFAALLFGTAYGIPDAMHTCQICALAAFALISVLFFRRSRLTDAAGTAKRRKR